MKQEKPVSLEESRKAIDEIDAELVRLFARRMECSRTVADYKRAHHMEVLNTAREEQGLKSRAALAGDFLPLYSDSARTPLENATVETKGFVLQLENRVVLRFVFDPAQYLQAGSLNDLTVFSR